MSVHEKLPLQEFRIAPFGYSVVGLGLGSGLSLLGLTCINHEVDSGLRALTAGMTVANMAVNTVLGRGLIKKQRSLHRRLETSVAQNGYDERIFATTTDEWCSRQTARLVCEAAGVLPQYEALCEERRQTAALTHIPHL